MLGVVPTFHRKCGGTCPKCRPSFASPPTATTGRAWPEASPELSSLLEGRVGVKKVHIPDGSQQFLSQRLFAALASILQSPSRCAKIAQAGWEETIKHESKQKTTKLPRMTQGHSGHSVASGTDQPQTESRTFGRSTYSAQYGNGIVARGPHSEGLRGTHSMASPFCFGVGAAGYAGEAPGQA
jgi:hypothetical protein